jgi:hypothetical protein
MLTPWKDYKMLSMVSVESTHPNPIHYNNRLSNIIIKKKI